MHRPDGSADENRCGYEHWWTLLECLRLLHGAIETLRIEALGAGRADLIVTAGTHRELHQVRPGHPSGAWSLFALGATHDRLLQNAGDRLAGNDDRFIFASGSPAPELAELCTAAHDAPDAEAFRYDWLTTRLRRERFARLLRYWACEGPAAFDRLRRTDIRTAAEADLERRVRWGQQALFVADANRVRAALLELVKDSLERTLTRRQLVERLARRGSRPRRLDEPERAGEAVAAATDRYLNTARRRLASGALMEREAAATLKTRLEGAASESILSGRAGAGKTACVVDVIEALRKRDVPVLAFRIDYVLSATTTADLGRRLGLEESPVLVLAEAAQTAGHAGILIVDQLDAASDLAGPDADPCALVERLVHEMRGTSTRATLHTVIVCRAFDWRNDPRLRRLVPAAAHVEVAELSREEVEGVLHAAGCDPASLHERQLEILRLPQHLALFLDGVADAAGAPTFAAASDLFDRYWTRKRHAVAARAAPLPDEWMAAVKTLCDEMNSTHRPNAPRERLDRVSPAYLQHLESEGVVTVDGRRYGLGHESLSDYFAARVWFNQRESLVSWLTGSEQHLARRPRVRQTLSYLRNADPALYVRELGELLADKGVRTHVKDLAFAVLADVPDPTEQEWRLWERWLAPALQALEKESANPERLSAVAWRRFFESPSWFAFADRHGVVEAWLASDNDRLASAALSYLGRHDIHAPDLVAALLEPYADLGGRWTDRLRLFMESADHHASRRLFDLFLHLIDNGTLDEARRRDSANGTFWSMLEGLREHRPEWVAEVLAHRLRRRLATIRSAGEDAASHELPGYDDDAAELFRSSAEQAPAAFVEHVLVPVLDISDATVTGTRPPKHDAVWPLVARTEYPEVDHACLAGLSTALAALARDADVDIEGVVSELRQRDTHVANQLLLAAYGGGATRYADEAAALLCDEPWRLQCGFSDSPQWYAAETLGEIVPHCTPASRDRMERLLLDHVAPDERGLRGFRQAGRARYTLLAAIPPDLRGKRANREVEGLATRFGQPEGGSRGIAVDSRSPLDHATVGAMTDEQWLTAIAQHRSKAAMPAADEFGGDTWALARHLATRAAEDPDRFAGLALRLPSDAHPVYLERTLSALKTGAVDSEIKLQVCRQAFERSRGPCGQSIAEVLGRIPDPLPRDAVRMLHWIATEHEDPVARTWQAEDAGIDSARGSAADAVRRLVARDAGYLKRFRTTLERLIRDPSASVRACAVGTLREVGEHDPALGMKLFLDVNLSEDGLLTAPQVYRFIRDHLRDRFADVRPLIERMLGSSESEICEAGARLASLAALEHAGAGKVPEGAMQPAVAAMSAQPGHRSAADLAADAMRGGPAHRLGVAHVAAANLPLPEYRAWSAATLTALFDDSDARVRRRAATCFRHLQDAPLDTHSRLIEAFCASKAFGDDPAALLHPLDASRERLPGVTCTVCETYLDRLATEWRDMATHRREEALTVATLAFRTYRQHPDDAWTSRALDLIDRLCLERIGDARDALEQFEC